MKVLVDGVFFQLASTGIARVWASILPKLTARPDVEIVMLDRGNAPEIEGIERIAFPSYTWNNTAADSLLVDTFARKIGADVFLSTYYTSPTSIPSVLLVYDMIPEVLGFDLSARAWKEKEAAISFAQYYVCISENTRADLLRIYPSIDAGRASVGHCGLDAETFQPRSKTEVDEFRVKYNVPEDYVLLVGSREQHSGYKNGALLFAALRAHKGKPSHVLCVGGEPELQPDFLKGLPRTVTVQKVNLTDRELSCAYSGGQALVYPSLYEGFGMPVIEAMACGCPVITTNLGSLAEVAGDAAVLVSGYDPQELVAAMGRVVDPGERPDIVQRGRARAATFHWDGMADEMYRMMKRAVSDRDTPKVAAFLRRWHELRSIQADVDAGI